MASASLITLQSFWPPRLSSNPISDRLQFRTHLTPSSLCSALYSSTLLNNGRLSQHLPMTSSPGVPNELTEATKFVPLNADDPIYGPPALLLLGFEADETDKITDFLKNLDGEFLKVVHCTEDMLARSVWDAIHTKQPRIEEVEIAKSLPRICFLSGLSGEEMMMFIDAFPETGLEPAVFAAVVPNSADKLLGDVMEEIMGDHELMSAQNPI